MPLWNASTVAAEEPMALAERLAAAPGCVGLSDGVGGRAAQVFASELAEALRQLGSAPLIWSPNSLRAPLPSGAPQAPWLAVGAWALAQVRPWCGVFLRDPFASRSVSEPARFRRSEANLILDDASPSQARALAAALHARWASR